MNSTNDKPEQVPLVTIDGVKYIVPEAVYAKMQEMTRDLERLDTGANEVSNFCDRLLERNAVLQAENEKMKRQVEQFIIRRN